MVDTNFTDSSFEAEVKSMVNVQSTQHVELSNVKILNFLAKGQTATTVCSVHIQNVTDCSLENLDISEARNAI